MIRHTGIRADGPPPTITQRHWSWGPLLRRCLAEPGEWFYEKRVNDPHSKATYLRGRYGVEVTVADLVGRKKTSTGTLWVRWPTVSNRPPEGNGEAPAASPSSEEEDHG